MANSVVGSIVDDLDLLDPALLSRTDVSVVLASVAMVRGWTDTIAVRLARRLQVLSETEPLIVADAIIATATRTSRRDAGQVTRRAKTLTAVPPLEAAMAAGDVSASHVDAMGRALEKLDAERRAVLAADGERLAEMAARSTPEQFERTLKIEVLRLDGVSGEDRLARQCRANRLRSWTDPDTGMLIIRCEFDPESGVTILSRIDAVTNALFHDRVPDTCPDGDGKQDHLRALALLRLVNGRHVAPVADAPPVEADSDSDSDVDSDTDSDSDSDSESDVDFDVQDAADPGTECGGTDPDADVMMGLLDNRCEMLIVIDFETIINGLHDKSIIDNGHHLDLPVETYRRMACTAKIIPVVFDTNGVAIDQGRAIRLANEHQRRQLIAMYSTCAMPGCTVSSRHCQPHHIRWWRNLGPTDIDNLIPVCSRHHHAVHEGGWQLRMHTNRSLTITYPNGATQSTGPPVMQRRAA